MTPIHQIIIRKKLFGAFTGAWSSPVTFTEFYFSYDEKESLIQDSKNCKCIDSSGNIMSAETAFEAYRNMEKEIIKQSSESGNTALNFKFT